LGVPDAASEGTGVAEACELTLTDGFVGGVCVLWIGAAHAVSNPNMIRAHTRKRILLLICYPLVITAP